LGGRVEFFHGLASLFTDRPFRTDLAECHADTTWISFFLDAGTKTNDAAARAAYVERAQAVEDAISSGATLSRPIATVGAFAHKDAVGHVLMDPSELVQWTKPVLILTGNLTASAGDFFPAILQANGMARTFGGPTMGAGGWVETMATLPYSRLKLKVTRTLSFVAPADGSARAPLDSEVFENNGVTPDYPYMVTVADFRAGFVGYFEAFSRVAAQLTR
jgi:hypothetical protein